MVSGADVRMALEAGLWEALLGSGDCAAMRSSCRDARTMADMLHNTAVLPVGPDTLCCAASIAAYHRRLGAVRALHVRYSAEDEDEQNAVQLMEAYSAALGTALPATHCSIDVFAGRQLPPPFAAVLLQRVVPGVERLDMALGSYGNTEQLLQALEPCTRLCALRITPLSVRHCPAVYRVPSNTSSFIFLHPGTGAALGALCKLSHLHTLTGPWRIAGAELQRLCDALPNLTTLGFHYLGLFDPLACISQRLHTLAAGGDAEDAACVLGISAMATALPAVQRLKGVRLLGEFDTQADLLVARDTVQRFAACAHEWTLRVRPRFSAHVVLGMPAGCLAPVQRLELDATWSASNAADVAAMLGCLLSAAPNLSTLTLHAYTDWDSAAMVLPLRQAAHLHTLHLAACDATCYGDSSSEQQAAALEGVVRCLVLPDAAGEVTHCRTLQRVLLYEAPLDALDACRRALQRDGITVVVDTYALPYF